MILYTLFSLSLLLLILFNKGIKEKSYLFLSLFVVIMYWGLSYIDVPDTQDYQYVYDHTNPRTNPGSSVATHFEVGFLYITWFFKKIGADYYLFQLFLFTIESILVVMGIKKLGVAYRDIGSIICLLGFWLPIVLMGALRQGIAIALFVYSLHFLLEKKYYYYVLLVGVSFFFHKSAVFLLVVPLWYLFTNIFIEKRIVLLVIFVVVNILHFSGFTLSSSFDGIFSLFISDVSEQDLSLANYGVYSETSVSESNFGLLKLLEIDFCYVIALLIHPEKDNKGFHLLSSLLLIYLILNMLVGGIIVHRISYYLQIPYYLILIKSLMSLISDFNVKRYGQYAFTYMYVFITCLIFSKPFSSAAIHEYHLLDALGL